MVIKVTIDSVSMGSLMSRFGKSFTFIWTVWGEWGMIRNIMKTFNVFDFRKFIDFKMVALHLI